MAKKLEPEEVALHSDALAAIVADTAERELRELDREIEAKRAEVADAGAAVESQLVRLDERRETLDAAETALGGRLAELEEWQRAASAEREQLELRAANLRAEQTELARTRAQAAQEQHRVDAAHAALENRRGEVERRAQEVARAEADLAQRERFLGRARSGAASAPRGGPACNCTLLEQRFDARGREFPDRVDEWRSYLYYLRSLADGDGMLPASFEGLVADVFAPLLD